jgi:hypothetical protein
MDNGSLGGPPACTKRNILRKHVVKPLVYVLTLLLWALVLMMAREAWIRFRTPDIASECAQIKRGISREQVRNLVNKQVPPKFVRDTKNKMQVIRADGSCFVTFDHSDRVVYSLLDINSASWPRD